MRLKIKQQIIKKAYKTRVITHNNGTFGSISSLTSQTMSGQSFSNQASIQSDLPTKGIQHRLFWINQVKFHQSLNPCKHINPIQDNPHWLLKLQFVPVKQAQLYQSSMVVNN